MHDNAARWTSAYLQTSSFPYEHNYLDLDEEIRDPLGDPVCRITSGPKDNEARAVDYGHEKWRNGSAPLEPSTSIALPAAEEATVPPRTPTVAPAWATILKPTWSTATDSPTKRPTWASWERQRWAQAAREIRP